LLYEKIALIIKVCELHDLLNMAGFVFRGYRLQSINTYEVTFLITKELKSNIGLMIKKYLLAGITYVIFFSWL